MVDQPLAFIPSVKSMFAAGRDPSTAFKDIRSPSKLRNRIRAQKRKYFDYRFVNAGQVSQPHYAASEHYAFFAPTFPADLSTCQTVNLTKQQLFKEAQFTAPLYRKGSCACCRSWRARDAEWRKRAAREEAYNWNKIKLHQDFSDVSGWDCTKYDELAYQDVEDYWDEVYCHSCELWETEFGAPNLLPGYEGDELQTVYDLESLVINALAGLGKPVEEEFGWEYLAMDEWDSPELPWVSDQTDVVEEEDDFELL
ncbi:hypothetical protein, variant [Verruconis gallopava]|uniref:Uncharacterized protein n=1 Tax=Verruconis gallopava TaxID=253628 RepID=A0A0D1YU37_9PEZI|nr:uncharacterized protein PV09_04497 [Verruconis gallopava]XP_016214056.1 hypothetical protein, variant [Verruconis gallopava]KIW04186.1 hypothetical protein PV09_04497 [Verruconis gallopava]KIW04187.1 hypothetical protein, variant [Verruconis gallopava]